MVLMLLGNAGVVTAISSLMLSFINPGGTEGFTLRLGLLIAGISLLFYFANSSFVDYHLSKLINRLLKKYSRMDIRDYAHLLNLAKGYRISEIRIQKDDWIENATLKEAQLRQEGINVLGVHKKSGAYVGVPKGDTKLQTGYTIVLYGRKDCVQKLEQRRKGSAGDAAHDDAVTLQNQEVDSEQKLYNK